MVEPHCSKFRIVTVIFLVSEYLGILKYLPDSFDLLILLTESLFHLGTESCKGGGSVGQFVLSILEGVLGVAEGSSQVVSLSCEGGIGCGKLVETSVGVLESVVGLAELV